MRKLGLFSMILLALNGIIGSGLFLLPGKAAGIVGNWALLVYFVVATIVMAIAWCFCKCASHFTRNGGSYLYAKEAFGDFIGFEIGFMRWAVSMIAWASLTVGFITALSAFYPVVLEAPYKQLLIIGLIGGLGILNYFGTTSVKKFNNVITIAKLIPLLLFLGFGLFSLHVGNFSGEGVMPFSVTDFGAAALLIFYAFSGFEILPVAAKEMENSKRNIPLAMMTAILLCSLLYFLVQAISIGVLGSDLIDSNSPISDAAALLFGNWVKHFVTFAMLASMGGIMIVNSFIAPRSCSALSEEKMLPAAFSAENRFGAPSLAIFCTVAITIAIALSGNFVQLVTISVISRFAQYITTSLSLYVFEKRGVMQPFDRPWKRFIPIFALTGVGWLILQADLIQLLLGFSALFVAIPLYFVQKKFLTPSQTDS